ncbi:MAG: ATP-binding protein [Campylobacterales bacterium]
MHELDKNFTSYVDPELLEKALNDSVIITVTDSEGIITYVNQHFIDISGYSKKDILGKTHSKIKHPDNDKEFFEDIWKTITAKKIWKGVNKNKKKDGSSYWVKTLIMPIISSDKIDGYLSIRTDITETMKLKEAQRNFHFRTVHELRNKLSSIKLSMDWIESLDNKYPEYLDEAIRAVSTIKNSHKHLERLVDDMSDMSKIDTNSVKLQLDWVNVRHIVDDLLVSIEDIIKNNNKFILINAPEDILVYIDDLRINQILFNIISNASKFTENGTIVLSINVEYENLIFTIQDSGKGITEDKKEYIFDEFWKDPLSQGFGLGLPISKGLAELMGGKMWFKSSKEGSTFYVSFKNFRKVYE